MPLFVFMVSESEFNSIPERIMLKLSDNRFSIIFLPMNPEAPRINIFFNKIGLVSILISRVKRDRLSFLFLKINS